MQKSIDAGIRKAMSFISLGMGVEVRIALCIAVRVVDASLSAKSVAFQLFLVD